MDNETPKEKKPRVLKRIKKKKLDLNVSSSTRKKKPFSYGRSNISLSTSIQKQSLRANNKALAFNLERSREALRFANESNLELQRSNQELHMKLTTLERVAGLKDRDIESEVNSRLKKHMSDLKTKMVGMRRLFYDAFACMDEVTDMCNLLSRHSSGGHRDASLGSSVCDSSMSQGTFDGHCRSLFSQIPKAGFSSALPSQDDLPSGSEPALLDLPSRAGLAPLAGVAYDMSMIAETSVLLDDISPPCDLMENITDIQETDNENIESQKVKSLSDSSSDNSVKMAPQRVLKKKRTSPPTDKSKNLPASVDQIALPVGSPAVRNKKLDRRGTFVINTPKTSNDVPSKPAFSKEHASDICMENEEGIPAAKISQTTNDPSNKQPAAGNDLSPKMNTLSKTTKSKSPVIGTKERSSSPITSKTRSRSKGRLDKPVLKVTECNANADVQDRRKTFVVPAMGPIKKPSTSKSEELLSVVDSVGETANDRRKTYLLPPAPSKTSNLSLSPVLMGNSDDMTQCFSLDMEMTEVIDSTQLIQLANSEQNRSKETEATERSLTEPEKEIAKTSKVVNESISLLPNSSDSSDPEAPSKPASVEFRIPRPGKIVFSASRKEIDGSRKPVPSKLPLKARSKSKIKLSRSKGRKDIVPESPKELKSIFDFHDRTPKAKEDTTAKTTGSVYDLSMNESLKDNIHKPSLSQFRESCEKQEKEKSSVGSKPADIKLLPDNPVYYAPLKECSPEPPVQIRSRSKSRTRKGDNACESRSSRARSRSRRQETEDKTDQDEIVVNVLESRGRSRSKRRQNTDVTSPDQVNNKESSSNRIESEAENSKSRGRSRSRRRADTVEPESEVIERSRSRNRRKDLDDEEEKASEKNIRTRSRSRRRKEQVEEDVVSDKDDLDSDGDFSNSRSRSIKRKRNPGDDIDLLSEKGGLRSRTRSRSKHHKEILENDVPLQDIDNNSNIEAEVTSENRQITDEDTSESKTEKENEGRTSTEKSSDGVYEAKEDIVNRKSRGRERSKSRGRVIQDTEDIEIVTRKSRGRSKSRRRRDTVDQESVGTNESSSQTKIGIVDCINIEETPDKELIMMKPSTPTEKVKAKIKLSLHKKDKKNSESSDTKKQSNTTKTMKDANSVEEKEAASEKKLRIDSSDEIPRLAEGLFVTKRGRSLKPSKQTLDTFDNEDLFFDFESLSNNHNVETNMIKLPKTPSTPAVEGSKVTPKDKTASSKLKKLKSSKKSTNKRRRSNCSSVSEAEQQTPRNSITDSETVSSIDKENDRPALGFSEQMQNIRKKLVSLDKRQSKTSIESQSSAGLSNFDFSKLDMGSSEPENKRQRRGTAQVSYKEMPLGTKLRREDVESSKKSKSCISNASTPVAKKT